jgi:maltose alpha-D-glucosyltransferase/alpha-amylase
MGRFLTEVSPFANIVPLAGALEYQSADGTIATLALLQGFVANQGDAWNYTLGTLRRFLEDCLLQPEAMKDQCDCDEANAVFLLMMQTLGRRTGELHRALATETGDPAFDPEPISAADVSAWNEQVCAEAVQTLDKLDRQQGSLPDVLRDLAQRLLASRNTVLERIHALQPVDLYALKTRYHGDYHLGQVLVKENDFVIIDFEGEPARTLEERRGKHSPSKDVAGMLRSFNYAAFAVLSDITADRPNDIALLGPFVRDWERKTINAFMSGYEEAVAGCAVYPEEPTYAQALIDLFVLEKAFYELRYELDNRPTWVSVPLGGLCELLVEE